MIVLLVEDSPVNQLFTTTLLKEVGVEHRIADTGLQALRILMNDKKQEIGLVLMDCQMPVLNGLRATKLLRRGYGGRGHKSTPVIALSGGSTRDDREACKKAGMNGYLEKPVTAEQLARLINSLTG